MKNRLLMIALLAAGAFFVSTSENHASAQYGWSAVPVGGRGSCYAPPRRHHRPHYAVPYSSYRAPYGYRRSAYLGPGITVTKSRQYIAPLPVYSMGYRGYGYGYGPGVGARSIPRVRLSLGF